MCCNTDDLQNAARGDRRQAQPAVRRCCMVRAQGTPRAVSAQAEAGMGRRGLGGRQGWTRAPPGEGKGFWDEPEVTAERRVNV